MKLRTRRHRVSALLRERRQAARSRASLERARRAGFDGALLQTALLSAYESWCLRFPWRFLPEWLRGFAFERFGKRFAARFLAAQVSNG